MEKLLSKSKKTETSFLELAQSGKAMTVVSKKAMAITECGWLTHLVSQNKQIWLWYCQLVHVSNTHLVGASRLVDGIDLNMDKKYDFTEVLVNLENSDSDALQTSDNNDVITNNINTTTTYELEPGIAE